MKVELLSITPECEKLIEVAGRTCYQSEVGDPSIIQRWIKSGHESVIEHCSATFKVSEVSRALTHQLVRHRIGFSYSQQSQRYVKESQFEYVIPASIVEADMVEQYMGFMYIVQEFYNTLTEKGVKKEDARFVLPNACYTEIVVTLNFRAARNFFKLRLDKHAQWEIRQMANFMLSLLKSKAPNCFYDFSEEI
jgi:thymidylate synthase (FAD)